MKNTLKSIICITIALFASMGNVHADEFIRYTMVDNTSSNTIIRHYTNNCNLACYHSTNSPFFIAYIDGVATTNMMYLPLMDTIYDFEIFEDTVYFCGISKKNVSGPAIVGYFDIASFLSSSLTTNVSYVALPSMKTVKAIDVGKFAERKHVVGIGKNLKAEGMMVDMIEEPSYWNLNFSNVGGDTILLSDLAITSSFVVVTSTRTGAIFVPSEFLWYIKKPVTPGQSLFPCNVIYKTHPGIYGTKFSIAKVLNDEFVTAYHYSVLPSSKPIALSYYDGYNYFRSVFIDETPNSIFSLQDLKIGLDNVEVLASGLYADPAGTFIISKVFEIPNTDPVPSIIFAHSYKGVFLTSIDRIAQLIFGDDHYYASGYDQSSGYGVPYYMKFMYHGFHGNCLDYVEEPARNIYLEKRTHSESLDNTMMQQFPEEIPASKKPAIVETKCYSQTQTDENDNEQE